MYREYTRRVGEWLDGFNTLARDVGFPESHPVVEGPQLEARHDVVMHLRPGSIDFEGTQIGTLDDLVENSELLRERLKVEVERIESVAEVTDRNLIADPLTVGVVVDPDVPAVRVGLLLEIVSEEMAYKVSFFGLFPGPRNPVVEPIPRELNELVEEYNLDPAETQRRLSEQIAEQVDRCEPLIESFTELYKAVPERRQQLFRETFPPAWHKCDCVVDVELVLSTEATATFGGHPVVYIPIEQKTDGDWHLVDGNQSFELTRGVQWGAVVPEQIRSTTQSDR